MTDILSIYLCFARTNKVTDPRDKRFTLLSLQEFLANNVPLKPDYGSIHNMGMRENRSVILAEGRSGDS